MAPVLVETNLYRVSFLSEAAARMAELLRLVGLGVEHVNRYPTQFSGGQRQRIGIARALALEPQVIVLGEPVSALDVSVQAGVNNLLARLKATLGLAYLFVSHDLSVIRHVADRVAVMYLRQIVEIGETDQVFDAPSHCTVPKLDVHVMTWGFTHST